MTWGAWIVVRASFGQCPADVNVHISADRNESDTRDRDLPDTLFAQTSPSRCSVVMGRESSKCP
jgi:hypothetical protein